MTLHSELPPGGLPLLTGAQTGAADEAAVAVGDSWDGLMARAGGALSRGVVELLRDRTGGVYGRRVLVVVGKGDNGGDGWVAARRLRDRGVHVTVLAPHGTDVDTSAQTAAARTAWLASGGRVLTDGEAYDDRWPGLARHELPDVAVDCVLGTGARGAPRPGPTAAAVGVLVGLGSARVGVVACDVPSGVDADTGAVEDPDLAVRADLTVTFGAAKRGLVLHPGAERTGVLRVADLGPRWELPEPFGTSAQREAWYATGDGLAAPRPWAPTADKRARGRVLVLAGSQRYGGAAALCGRAALRTGAGLVTVATSASTAPVLAVEPGLMVRSLPAADDGVGGPSPDAIDAVTEALADTTAAVVGPGLGHEDGTREVVEAVLAATPQSGRRTVVLDADGCNVFRHDVDGLAGVVGERVTLVLTPHERELARLLDTDVASGAGERADQARELADATGAVVVAKGPATLVVGADGPVLVGTSGSPALGTGGSGDVLAGMLGAVHARDGSSGFDALELAAGTVHLHGLAGELAGAHSGGRATASDLLDVLPGLLAKLAVRREARGWRWSGT